MKLRSVLIDLALVIAIVSGCHCVCAGDDDLVPIPDPISTQRIILPMTPVTTEPDAPEPPKPVEPTVISTIKADEWYVIESLVELITLQSPEGLLTIDVDAGPITLRGKFADGTGKIERRKYTSPFVYSVSSEKPGKTELILIPVGVTESDDIVRQVLTVSGVGPQPPPEPGPGPGPGPTPPPGPVVPGKLQIVIIEDPALRGSIPASQIAVMDGSEIRDYCKTHCVLTDGHPDFRKLSFRQDVTSQPKWIKDAFAEPRTSLPFLVVLTPSKVVAGPLPATVEETLTLLKTYGGP